MANWNEVRTEAGRVAEQAVKKTGELADEAALRVRIGMTQAKLKDSYATLGKLTYRQLKLEESQAEAIAPVIERIDTLREDYKVLNAKLLTIKEERKARAAAQKAQKVAEKEQQRKAAEDALVAEATEKIQTLKNEKE